MPTRMENKGNGRNHRRLWWIIGSIIVVALIGGDLAYAYSGSDEDSSASSSSAKVIKKETTKSSQKKAKSSSTSSSSSNSVTADNLVGLGFQIMPVLYNGEDVNTAMNEHKAPQNTAHDGAQQGYFLSTSEVKIAGISRYMYAHTTNFSVVDGVLELNVWNFPIKVADGAIQTTQGETEDNDGNTITWEIKALPDAKSVVDSHNNPNEPSSGSNSGSVDQHNLTTAQMEHWVRSYLASTSQNYSASDYTFTQKFVDGTLKSASMQRTPTQVSVGWLRFIALMKTAICKRKANPVLVIGKSFQSSTTDLEVIK